MTKRRRSALPSSSQRICTSELALPAAVFPQEFAQSVASPGPARPRPGAAEHRPHGDAVLLQKGPGGLCGCPLSVTEQEGPLSGRDRNERSDDRPAAGTGLVSALRVPARGKHTSRTRRRLERGLGPAAWGGACCVGAVFTQKDSGLFVQTGSVTGPPGSPPRSCGTRGGGEGGSQALRHGDRVEGANSIINSYLGSNSKVSIC